MMNVVIKKLDNSLIEEYIHFHKNVAFTDNPEWAGCYCVWYHWNHELDKERSEFENKGGTEFKMHLARRMIEKGQLQGYLAFIDNEVVGWVNTNNRNNYCKLSKNHAPKIWDGYNNEVVQSILCFTIAPNFRRKGLSGLLLDKIINDAKNENLDFIEVYPGTGEADERSYRGTLSVYQRRGFTQLKNDPETMRLYLKK